MSAQEQPDSGVRIYARSQLEQMTTDVVMHGLDGAVEKANEVELPDGTLYCIVILDAADREVEPPSSVGHAGTLSDNVGDRYGALVSLAARQVQRQSDDPEDYLTAIAACLDAAKRLSSDLGLNMAVMDLDELTAAVGSRSPRRTVKRTERPSGRGGRSRLQKRKR
jgi:hypothetical protein